MSLPPTEDQYLWTVLTTITLAVIFTVGFKIIKDREKENRLRQCNMTVCVIGAGPVGLCSLLAASRCSRVRRLVLYEQRSPKEMTRRLQQVVIDKWTRDFLREIGVDFDNMEGEFRNSYFYTRCGVLVDYLLTKIDKLQSSSSHQTFDIKINSKFNNDSFANLPRDTRTLIIVCDGHDGQSARVLGVGDEFQNYSCKTYGAMATFDRLNVNSVSLPEIRVHNLNFDLSAYGYTQSRKQKEIEDHLELTYGVRVNEACVVEGGVSSCGEVGAVRTSPYSSFHLKLMGTARNRVLSVAVARHLGGQHESPVVKALKVVLDQGVMRNLFRISYNTYKPSDESEITDILAVRCMKFNPRLFEIRLSERIESAIYIVEDNCFVITEGEASIWLNFRTGMDINLALRGLFNLSEIVEQATTASTDQDIIQVIHAKLAYSRGIVNQFVKQGFSDAMFS